MRSVVLLLAVFASTGAFAQEIDEAARDYQTCLVHKYAAERAKGNIDAYWKAEELCRAELSSSEPADGEAEDDISSEAHGPEKKAAS